MTRTVTVIQRIDGAASITADRQEIDCDDDFSGVKQIVQEAQAAGHTLVLVLLADDSVSPCGHWTQPSA